MKKKIIGLNFDSIEVLTKKVEVKTYRLMTFLFFSIFIFSCEKDISLQNKEGVKNEKFNPVNVNTFTYTQKVVYLEENLLTLAQSLYPLTKTQQLKKQLYVEIEKKFDGDYNVLFKSLTNLIPFQSSSLKKNYLKSIDAFKNLDDRDYFPQLAIPLHKTYLQNDIYNKNQNIIIAILTDDGNLLDGYKFNNNGLLEKLPNKIDKNFAERNEVWVVSLNERYFGKDASKGSRIESNNQITAGLTTKWQITTLNIKKAYEGWGKGDSDIYIIGAYGKNADLGYFCGLRCAGSFDISDWNAKCYIRDVAENDLNKNLTINWRVDNSNTGGIVWNDLSVGDAVYFTIYEDDSWPTGSRDWKIYAADNINFLYQVFRSGDPQYCSARIKNTDINNTVIENSSIRVVFNTL